MSYVNVGAYVDGRRPKSKKAIKEALADNINRVRFDVTSLMGPLAGEMILGPSLASVLAEHVLSLVGPDPYTDRRFYGSVSVNASGKVVVR